MATVISRILPFSMLVVCAWACSGDDDAPGGPNGSGGNPFGNATGDDVSMPMQRDGGDPRLDTCGAEPFVARARDVNVLLVIDKSGSMLDVPEGFAVDKWSAMKGSLATALDGVKESLSLGLMLYPSTGCDVPTDVAVEIAEGSSALPDIDDALERATPEGGTPTAVALQRALAYFEDGAGADLSGDKFVLLATDGGPNCNDSLTCDASECITNIDGRCPMDVANCCDQALGTEAQQSCVDDVRARSAIEELAAAGVPTFVVGIPGTEQYSAVLENLATAGERPSADAPPSYYAVTAQGDEPGGLTEVLSAIASSLIKTCRLQLGSTPPTLDRINVKVDGEIVPQTGSDGWEIDVSTDPPTIELLGETCDRVESSGAESVEVLFGCPTILG